MKYLESCIQQKPDILLEELRDALREVRGVQVSTITILRTLQ